MLGVYKYVRGSHRHYRAQVVHNGKRITVGDFQSLHKAARAYNQAALAIIGPGAELNDLASLRPCRLHPRHAGRTVRHGIKGFRPSDVSETRTSRFVVTYVGHPFRGADRVTYVGRPFRGADQQD